jgi:hypothetical protein
MNTNNKAHDALVDEVLAGFDLAAEHHLANCQPCQAERERMEDTLRQFAAVSRDYAHRPESFWELQAARIRSARSESGQRSRLTLILAPSVVVLLLLAFAALGKAPGVRPTVAATQAMPNDSDHELLLEVERAMQADTPLALEPATLMVEEDYGGLPLDTPSERKETRSHEN